MASFWLLAPTGASGRGSSKVCFHDSARKIYAAARNLETLNPLVSSLGEGVSPILIVLNRPATIEAAAEAATDVEILINNAGTLYLEGPLFRNAEAALQDEMVVNTYGLMRIAQAFASILKANSGGVLVQVNSVLSMKRFANFATYSASKAASYSITQALREVLKEQVTRVLSVHLGPIATDMDQSAGLTEMAEPADLVPKAIIAALASDDFHVYPNTTAKQIDAAYWGFVTNIVGSDLMEAWGLDRRNLGSAVDWHFLSTPAPRSVRPQEHAQSIFVS